MHDGKLHRLVGPELPASDWLPGTRGLAGACVFVSGCSHLAGACLAVRPVHTSLQGVLSSSDPDFYTRRI